MSILDFIDMSADYSMSFEDFEALMANYDDHFNQGRAGCYLGTMTKLADGTGAAVLSGKTSYIYKEDPKLAGILEGYDLYLTGIKFEKYPGAFLTSFRPDIVSFFNDVKKLWILNRIRNMESDGKYVLNVSLNIKNLTVVRDKTLKNRKSGT
jgi:hypothetical protein